MSILDPASAIFFAALMTSDVFFSGPFPLKKKHTHTLSLQLGHTGTDYSTTWCSASAENEIKTREC